MPRSRSPSRATTLTAVLVTLAVAAWPRALVRAQVGHLEVRGRAALTEGHATVTCTERSELRRCEIELRYRLRAIGDGVSVCEAPCSVAPAAGRVQVDGAPLAARRAIPDGTEVEVSSAGTLTVGEGRAMWFVHPPMTLRHPLLGAGPPDAEEPWLDVPFATGIGVDPAPIEVHAEDVADVEVRAGRGSVRLRPPGPNVSTTEPLRHGGPEITLGAAVELHAPYAERFSVSAGYEIALGDSVFVSASVATDLQSLFESLVVEACLPGFLFFVPSLSAGLGIVARQLGDRGADAALRLRGALNWYGFGFRVDVDYWPAVGGWTVTPAFRVGL